MGGARESEMELFSCPSCRSPIGRGPEGGVDCACGAVYPRLPAGGIDFLEGLGFPDFQLDGADPEQRRLLAEEAAGVSWRIGNFLLPLIRRYAIAAGKAGKPLAVLDSGCGSGISVDIFRENGLDACGIDAGRARHEQWLGRSCGPSLHSANACSLPFRRAHFDVVVSSGLIEHIGIHEEIAGGYRARRLPDCGRQRKLFIQEIVRVLKDDGFVLLDHPNGGFPADFWHGSEPGRIRWHGLRNDMLPRWGEIEEYFRSADPSLRLFSLSPVRRLRFQQVGRHFYGRVLAPIAAAWLKLLDVRGFSPLARSFLNPYLVTLACRLPGRLEWIRP